MTSNQHHNEPVLALVLLLNFIWLAYGGHLILVGMSLGEKEKCGHTHRANWCLHTHEELND